MASTNGLQGAPSNLTNTIDGLTYLYANGQEITGLYINSQTSTSDVDATIILDAAGKLQVQNSVLAPIFTIDNTNITSMYESFTNILTTPNINAYGDLNLNISNNTLISVVRIKDADGVDLVRTGYFDYGGTFGNKAIQLNSVPLVVEAGITGTVLPETITDPNWEQIRIFNTNVANIFTSICCDGVGTYFITTDTFSNAVTDKPNYAGRTNFYLLPDQSTNFQGNIYSNGTFTAFGDLSALGTSVFGGIAAFKNDLSFFNPLNANPYLTQLITTNDYSLDTSHWDFFNGVNFATIWNDLTLPFSNVRMMNGNKDPSETSFNSFFDIKVEGKFCYFYFSPTTTSYYVDAPTLEVMNFDVLGNTTIANLNISGGLSVANLSLSGTLNVAGLTTLNNVVVNGTITAPLNLSSATANQFINLLGTGGVGSQSCLMKFQILGSTGPSAQIGLTSGVQTVIIAPGVFVVVTNSITGLSQGITGLVNCAQGLNVTGQTATTTLNVSSTSVQTGITNTGALSTTTLNVSSTSVQTGITNTGSLTNNGNFTMNVPAGSIANINTGKLQIGNNVASPTDGFVICNGFLQCNNNGGMEVNNGPAVFQQKASVQGLLAINGGAQGTMVYNRIPMNIFGGSTILTANNISNAYIYSNTNITGAQMLLHLPTGTDLALVWGQNAIIEFYIEQCGILNIPSGGISGYYGIVVDHSGAEFITTDLTVTGPPTAGVGAFVPRIWSALSPYPLATACYKCVVNIQNSVAYYNFKYNGHPLPSAGWS